MKLKQTKIFTTALFAIGLTNIAHAIDETEPNNSIYMAQALTGAGMHSITAKFGGDTGTQHSDLDFFSFEAKAGDILDIDIDHGVDDDSNINSILAVYDDTGMLLRMNSKTRTLDPGSSSTLDARIDKFVAPKDGLYTVGVSDIPRYFVDGGNVLTFFGGTTTASGQYTLNISGISYNSTQHINIEVKPGSNELSPLNPRAKGKIPVAILGSADFNVGRINQSTLTFGSAGDENSLVKCQKSLHDINNDHYPDLICHFQNQVAGFKGGDIEGIVKGSTDTGNFEGRSLLKVIPSRQK